jgi:cobalt-zinc-cadmium resistance protein CzcA
VPAALFLIFILLFVTFQSVRETLIIFSAIPLAAIGGIAALWIRGMNFSISAGIGFIALFGVAVLNGIVLINYFNRLEKEGEENIINRILKGTSARLRPVLATAAVASLGFLPMALSNSAGSEVQKPLATVVIGDWISSTCLHSLYFLYVQFIWKEARKSFAFTGNRGGNSFFPFVSSNQLRPAGEPPWTSAKKLLRLMRLSAWPRRTILWLNRQCMDCRNRKLCENQTLRLIL